MRHLSSHVFWTKKCPIRRESCPRPPVPHQEGILPRPRVPSSLPSVYILELRAPFTRLQISCYRLHSLDIKMLKWEQQEACKSCPTTIHILFISFVSQKHHQKPGSQRTRANIIVAALSTGKDGTHCQQQTDAAS